jgi:putative peptide zinc metalloprotease protein
MRPDLVSLPPDPYGCRAWRLKDPISLEYFQLTEEEYFILSKLNGQRTLNEIRQGFENQFAPRLLSLSRLQAYISHLHRTGLILAESAGQGAFLLESSRSAVHWKFWSKFLNPLAIHFRGFDPEPLLKWLYPKCRWLFSTATSVAALCAVLSACVLLISQFDRIHERVPEFQSYLTPAAIGWLAVALFVTKVLHELGHALAARHYGIECHEMGLMLLVFTPCLYCNVSDAWMLREKAPRVIISAAGIFVEFVLASGCLFLWWLSQPGLWNSIFFNIVLVCSVGTLAFNGNPLLRYDGYYIISDILDLPNLAERSSLAVENAIVGWLTGRSDDHVSVENRRTTRFFIVYGLLAAGYRLFIVSTILVVCWRWFSGMALRSFGVVFIATVVTGWFVVPARRFAGSLADALRNENVNRGRIRWTVALLVVLSLGALVLPVPQFISTKAFVQMAESQSVHVTVAGRLKQTLAIGTAVAAGQRIAELDNPDLDQEIEKLERECQRQKLHLRNLETRQGIDPLAAKEIPTTHAALAEAEAALKQRREDAAGLKLTAPRAGVLLPPKTIERARNPQGGLPVWSGVPQDPRNVGSWLESGTHFCAVGPHDAFEATLVVSQSEIELVQKGQTVKVLLDQFPGRILHGRVAEIAAMNVELVPAELIGDRDTAVRREDSGEFRPAETSYQARVVLDPTDLPLSLRARGRAKVRVASSTVAQQLIRLARQVLHFRLQIFP